MKFINVNIKNETITVNNEDCSFYEAGLYINDDSQFKDGQYPPLKDKDEIKEALIEKHGEDIVITFIYEIKINEDNLRKTIQNALEQAHDFSMSGWRLPIFVEENGDLEIGGWMSQGSWQPGADELWSVESWTVDEWYDNEGNVVEKEELSEKDIKENIEAVIDGLIDFHMEGIERKIDEENAKQEEKADMNYHEIKYMIENDYRNIPNEITIYQYEIID